MADVNRGLGDGGKRGGERDGGTRAGGNRDRGQLILVTGLAVAVTLVALVLLLNTVIYTQNLATRGTGVDNGEAVAFQTEAKSGVGEVIGAENRDGYDDWAAVESNVTAAVERYDDLYSQYSGQRGTVADVEEETLVLSEGTLLYQTNASRNFTSAGGDDDWMLVENVSTVRSFRATVSAENLSDGDAGAFTIYLDGESVTKRVYVYSDADGDVAVSNDADGSAPEECTTADPAAIVDLTAGTVGGTDCPELDYPSGGDEYNVTFENGAEATGTYELTVGLPRDDAKVKTDNFADLDAEPSPQAVPAVYDAEFDVHFETPTLEYHTRVRVAPGEPE